MGYSPTGGALTNHQESLQCLACAARMELGELDYNTLITLMKQDNNDRGPEATTIWGNVGIDDTTKKGLSSWATDPGNKKLLDTWINSSVYVADSLAGDKHFKSGEYVFYRQDQFPTPGASFKQVFNGLISDIKYDLKTSAIRSIKAGCNIVLYCKGKATETKMLLKHVPFIDNFTSKKTSEFYKYLR